MAALPETRADVRRAPTIVFFCTGDYVLASGDFNGDGRSDVLCGVDKVGVAGTSGSLADLMTSTTNELGGTTTVTYTPSSAFPNNNDPAVRHVVTALTTDDGRGGVATTTYSYDGATVDRQEGRTFGFEHMVTTLPCLAQETQCPYVETTNSLELAAAGRPTSIERFAANGSLLTSQTYTYTTNGAAIPRQALLTRHDSHVYGPSETLDTHETYEYDTYGNRTQTIVWGTPNSRVTKSRPTLRTRTTRRTTSSGESAR